MSLIQLPTILLKEHIGTLAHITTTIVNQSSQHNEVCLSLKIALLRPLLKKADLQSKLSHFRPVLNFFRADWLNKQSVINLTYQDTNKWLDKLQAGYKRNHSIETVFCKVESSILEKMDNREVICLVMLDLSTAFDAVNHNILLEHLHTHIGIGGMVLLWLKEYLTGCVQNIVIQNKDKGWPVTSQEALLYQGVPQWSVLGVVLFSVYISPVSDICGHYSMDHHIYTDDQQLYLSFVMLSHLPHILIVYQESVTVYVISNDECL